MKSPGKALAARHNFYEQNLIGLKGRGYTMVGHAHTPVRWNGRRQSVYGSFERGPSPLQCGFGTSRASLGDYDLPPDAAIIGSLRLINELPFEFTNRFDGSPDYYTKRKRIELRWDEANLVPDMRETELVEWNERGGGDRSIFGKWAVRRSWNPTRRNSKWVPISWDTVILRSHILTLNGKGFSLRGKMAWMNRSP